MATNTPAQKYFIRFSDAGDFDKLIAFYDENAHQNVFKRQEDLMKKRIEEGAVVLIEDEQGQIFASSITHPLMAVEGDTEARWHEVGTTRIVLNGFGDIFNAMVAMQVLRAFFFEPPKDIFVAHMETDPVQKKAQAIGWRNLKDMPEGLREAKARTTAPGSGHETNPSDWFGLGMEAMPGLAAWLENLAKNPVLTNKKTGEEIELDLSKSTFFTTFRDEIKQLAADTTLGTPDAFDAKQHLRAGRTAWQKKNFR